ncbi:MAG: hypothetical protein IPL77_16560 [Flavobacteriales bacterium]|nr:hypothetical protein [Flavobacteriales bacterium]
MRRRLSHALWAIPLLVLMALQLGHLASFEWKRRTVRKEIKLRLKAGVPQEERTPFQVTQAEYAALDWVKPQREFRLNGRFYDVVELHVQADETFLLSCIDDHQETELFAHLSDLVDLAMGTRGMGRQQTGHILAFCKAVPDEAPLSFSLVRTPMSVRYPCERATLLSGVRNVQVPPPKA